MTPFLEIDQLTKQFRHQWTFRPLCALKGLSLSVREGEIFGLIGHNGAGKTTTFKLLVGLLRPTSGRAALLGKSCDSTWARRQIGFLPEQPYFYDYLSVREILEFYGQLCGVSSADCAQRIGQLAERLQLTAKLNAPIRSLSKGTLQRIGIAQAIIHQPRMVILDEPMSGLDPSGRREMRDLIRSLKTTGTTVIFSSHILPDAEMLCDRVGILARGELREVIDLARVSNETQPRAFALTVSGLGQPAISALQALANAPVAGGPSVWTLTLADRARAQEALQLVHTAGGAVESLVPVAPSLEERFLASMGIAQGSP